MENWRSYIKLLGELEQAMRELSEIERDKMGAVSRGDVNGVDECMRREQARSMALRGIDQRREKLLRQMGLEGVVLRDLADHAPEELYSEVEAAAEGTRRAYALFQTASQLARDTLECHLRAIEKAQAGADGDVMPQTDQPPQADFRA